MLDQLRDGIQVALKKLIGVDVVDEAAVKEFTRDLQRTLLQGDVNVKQVFELTSHVEQRALAERPPPGLSRKDQIVRILYDETVKILGESGEVTLPVDRPSVILLLGIQGSGKTSIAGKLARHLKKKGYRVGVICGDTFRPGAYAQLKTLASLAGVDVFGRENGGSDPIGIIQEGLRQFKEKGLNVIIVDTAGRHKEEKSLLEEMRSVSSIIHPDHTILVLDGTIGQACKAQAEAFHNAVPVGGIAVTKLDGSAKGGGALAAASATGARIFFLSTGERIDDLEVFSPTRFVGRLLGLGDLQTLLEHARDLEVEADETKLRRIMSGKMTIDDLYSQFEQVKKMGSLRKLLELIPGLSSGIQGKDLEGVEAQMERWRYMIQSMTREERQDPDVLNSSRIRRIASGSGGSEKEVREMMSRYKQAKAVMKASKGRAFRELSRRFAKE